MAELTANNLQAFNNDAEIRFIEKAKERIKATLFAVLDIANEQAHNDYYTKEQIHEFTLLGIKRARSHNLLTEGEILDYLWLMCWLGAYFDIDPHYRALHPYINPTQDELKQGKTIHATFFASPYIKMLNTPVNAPLERLMGLKEDMLVGQKNDLYEKNNKSDANSKPLLDKSTLVNTIKYYMPTNQEIHKDTGLIEAIYAQCQPQGLQLKTRNSHIAWFMLSVEKGYRFYDNPLYSQIPEILKKNNNSNEVQRVAQIIDVLIDKSAQP